MFLLILLARMRGTVLHLMMCMFQNVYVCICQLEKVEEITHEENIFKNRFKGKRKLKLVHYMLHSHSRQFI